LIICRSLGSLKPHELLVPDVYEALNHIAAARRDDPLSPVTFVTPSHASSIQLRRLLAERGPFAAVRFETLPRLAELTGSALLAASGRAPLARPIGDHLAAEVARESRGPLASVGSLPGYSRVLRQVFRRLRRAGIQSSADVAGITLGKQPQEVLRLYDLFRESCSRFYDEEDLLDAAGDAVRSSAAGALRDLGRIYVVPPGALTAAGSGFLHALTESGLAVEVLDEPTNSAAQRFSIAPDPACEAREVVREVIAALDRGVALDELAVFHGADGAYGPLLRDTFRSSEVPVVPLPGVPLIETRAGRAVLWLAELPQKEYARAAVMDFLSTAPGLEWLAVGTDRVRQSVAAWDRISREAGVTRGAEVWEARLKALIEDKRLERYALQDSDREYLVPAVESAMKDGERLALVVASMAQMLAPLRASQPAASFIEGFKSVVKAYVSPDAPAMAEVEAEIDQLGTVGAVGGSFDLDRFTRALRANLEMAYLRPNSLGNGVVVADHRIAAGLRFREVILCGAFESAVPAGPGADSLMEDRVWVNLKQRFPCTEDKATRITRAKDAVRRTVAAPAGTLTWSCPAYEQGGTREYYPSSMMTAAFGAATGSNVRSADLRSGEVPDGPLHRSPSPFATLFRGPVIDVAELAVRGTADSVASNAADLSHPKWDAARMLRARRGSSFTFWDGNLSDLADSEWIGLQRLVSPTSLENYAKCGFRYLCRSGLRLEGVDEPEEREVMDAAQRGSLVHAILERFFKAQSELGRPGVGEGWNTDDEGLLIAIAEEQLGLARERGVTGLDIFADHDTRTIIADLRRFLAEDTAFRKETGAVPFAFEAVIPETEVLPGVVLRGRVDRVDRTIDGQRAWIIDYKTGRADDKSTPGDPLAGGTQLQLPAYVSAAADAMEVRTLYWFITQRGGFTKVEREVTPELMERFRDAVNAIVQGIRAGAFPAVPGEEDEFWGGFKNCSYCEFDRICSRRREIEFMAKESDTAMAPWKGVQVAAAGGTE
jgi:RecB family exonuclease